MTVIQKEFLSLVSACIHQTPATIANPLTVSDWESIYRLSQIHQMTGLVAEAVRTLPASQLPPEAFLQKLEKEKWATVVHMTQWEYAMTQLMEKMNNACIPFVLMKGFILRNLYPVKELRTFGDIDFLIHQSDRVKADDLMKSNGFSSVPYGDVWSYAKSFEHYDIHTHIMSDEFSKLADMGDFFDSPWNHTVPYTEAGGYVFTDEYHFLYLLAHLAKHISHQGAGVRMFLDIALMMKELSLNWDYLFQSLKQMRLSDFSSYVFGLCQKWFAIPLPPSVSPPAADILEDFGDYVLHSGVFGHHANSAEAVELRQLREKSGKGSSSEVRVTSFLKAVFPPVSVLQKRYPLLQNRLWMWPVYWLIHSVDVILHRPARIRSRLKNLSQGSKEADDQFTLLKNIGLIS